MIKTFIALALSVVSCLSHAQVNVKCSSKLMQTDGPLEGLVLDEQVAYLGLEGDYNEFEFNHEKQKVHVYLDFDLNQLEKEKSLYEVTILTLGHNVRSTTQMKLEKEFPESFEFFEDVIVENYFSRHDKLTALAIKVSCNLTAIN